VQPEIDSLGNERPGSLGSTLLGEGGQAVRDRFSGEQVARYSGIDSPGRRCSDSQGSTLWGANGQVVRDRLPWEKEAR
jgi:hypothetical protein